MVNNNSLFSKRFMDKNLLKKITEHDDKLPDTAETIHISALALLKMLRHGVAGVPLEVMGLMLGEQIDEYTIYVVDVFAMPQTAMGISVEAIDHVFQAKMLEMLTRTSRKENVVGWYHSHPGFGCWLSSVDCQTQSTFESVDPRAVAVVIDPLQSVRGKVIIDAFRSINTVSFITTPDVRSITSNLGHIQKPSVISIVHGLNRSYYSLNISYTRFDVEQNMLKNLNKKEWSAGIIPYDFDKHVKQNLTKLDSVNNLLKLYEKFCKEEGEIPPETFSIMNVGRKDPRKHLNDITLDLMRMNVSQSFKGHVSTFIF